MLTPQANGPLLSDIGRGRGAALGLDEKCPLQAGGVGMRPFESCSLGLLKKQLLKIHRTLESQPLISGDFFSKQEW